MKELDATTRTAMLDGITYIHGLLASMPPLKCGYNIEVKLDMATMTSGDIKMSEDYRFSYYSFDDLRNLREMIEEFTIRAKKVNPYEHEEL